MEMIRKLILTIKSAFAVVCITCMANTQAAMLDIPDTPLFLGGVVPPNIVYILDDSGSMREEWMPGSVNGLPSGTSRTRNELFLNPASVWSDSGAARNRVATFEDNNLHNYARRSFANNSIFYNPNVDYRPWVNADNTEMANANPNCAYYDPMRQASGCLNLLIQKTDTARWYRNLYLVDALADDMNTVENACNPSDNNATCAMTYWPITYYIYEGVPDNVAQLTDASNYRKIQIQGSTLLVNGVPMTTTASFSSITRTPTEEAQNFANWFQYHRARIAVARAGTGRAFAQQSNSMRVGFGSLNTGFIGAYSSASIQTGTNTSSRQVDGATHPTTLRLGVRPFGGTYRQSFFNDLYTIEAIGDTPSRRALADIGLYYSRTDNAGPWGNIPGSNDNTPHSECRQSSAILTSDGFWDIDVPETTATSLGNVDNSNGPTIINHNANPTPPSYRYTPVDPYRDNWGGGTVTKDGVAIPQNTLADVAMYFWNRDLRTDLPNIVPTSAQDEAFWQHMTSYTVSLGISGTLDSTDPTVLQDLTNGAISWPDPIPSQNATRGDDLWHAAINGRGEFLNAADSDSFATALSNILQSIDNGISSAAAVALNSGTITSTSQLYQARFDSGEWTGQLLAFPINADGTLGRQAWDAGAVVSGQNFNTGRKIITYKPSTGTGIPFRWPSNPASPSSTELDVSQSSALDINPSSGTADGQGQARLNYLRGDTSNINFRARSSVLGDIINSAPVFVGAPNLPYPDLWGTGAPENSAPYSSSFKNNTTYVNRTPMVYVGANDGMMHGFRDSDGTETFAYVPSNTFANLNRLTDPNYKHRFFVDGPVNVVDAYLGSGLGWRSVLAGSLGAGGQGVYALDVSVPPGSGGGAESSITNKVLWEFTDADDADLGRTFGLVNIVRMHNGKWAAVFGNGYNNTEADGSVSSTGNAVLYIVFIEEGLDGVWSSTDFVKIDTGKGTADDPTGSGQPNGLASPAVIDIDGDFIADHIYAGDLFGNLWKFDVTNTNTNNWGSDYLDASFNPLPLFVASDASNNPQAITTTPQVGIHPLGITNGVMVYFGTGKYLETGDNTQFGQDTQSFYGVWDKNQSTLDVFNRGDLLQQSITQEVNSGGFDLRASTDNQIVWHTASGTPSGSPPVTHLGWYMDLINLQLDSSSSPTNSNNFGERQVTNAVLRNDRIIFTTLIPPTSPCRGDGTGWLMEIDPRDGSRIDFVIFDINIDGVFDDNDMIQVLFDVDGDGDVDADDKLPPSGKKSTVGIIPAVSIIQKPGGGGECINGIMVKYASGSMGAIEATANNCGPDALGRQTWRQLDR